MIKTMRLLAILCVSLCLLMLLSGCGANYAERFVGTWAGSESIAANGDFPFERARSWTFTADGGAIVTLEAADGGTYTRECTYQVTDDTLTIDPVDDETSYGVPYQLSARGDILTIGSGTNGADFQKVK